MRNNSPHPRKTFVFSMCRNITSLGQNLLRLWKSIYNNRFFSSFLKIWMAIFLFAPQIPVNTRNQRTSASIFSFGKLKSSHNERSFVKSLPQIFHTSQGGHKGSVPKETSFCVLQHAYTANSDESHKLNTEHPPHPHKKKKSLGPTCLPPPKHINTNSTC